MITARDQFAQIAHEGEAHYAGTKLADGHASVTRSVRRHRTVRAAAGTVAGIGVIGGATWGGFATFGQGNAVAPGGTAVGPATTSELPSPSPSASPSPVATRIQDSISLPSGTTLDPIATRLAEAYGVPQQHALDAIGASIKELIPEAGTTEGWTMPGTFDLTSSPTVADAADQLVTARVMELTDLGVARSDWQTVLTKASLVEREAPLDVDRPKVARVIDNRLAQGMKLELDSTIKYIAPSEGIYTTEEDRATDSPYNTYVYAGLPPAAIASPSDESIQAVLNPAEGDWLFFVTVNLETGETAYASTFPDHQRNVQTLHEWEAAQAPGATDSPSNG